MSVGYLIGAALMAICTACALWPPRARGWLGTAAYLVGMVYNELPVLAMVWVAAPTLIAVAQGDFDPQYDLVPATLTAAALIGLVVVLWRALRGRDVASGPWRRVSGPIGDRRSILTWPQDCGPECRCCARYCSRSYGADRTWSESRLRAVSQQRR